MFHAVAVAVGIKMANEYDEICSMLKKAGFEADVIQIFRENRIDKDTFLDLNEDLLELNITALGDRKRIQKMKNIQFGINHFDQRKRRDTSPPEEDFQPHKRIRSDQGNYNADFYYTPGDKLPRNTATGLEEIAIQQWSGDARAAGISLIDDCLEEDHAVSHCTNMNSVPSHFFQILYQ